jgi:hypothetical protein
MARHLDQNEIDTIRARIATQRPLHWALALDMLDEIDRLRRENARLLEAAKQSQP